MNKNEDPRHLQPGTRIKITCQGRTVECTVRFASNYGGYAGKPDDWIIEAEAASGPVYWKQDPDGGSFEIVKEG